MHDYMKGIGTLFACVLLAACSSTATSSEISESASPSEIEASVESSPSPPNEITSRPVESDPAALKELQALALAGSGCLSGNHDFAPTDTVSWFPRRWLGVILRHGLDVGAFELPRKRDDFTLMMLDIHYSDYITEAFEAAASLDSRYDRLVFLWNTAGAKSIKAWDGGGKNAMEVLDPGEFASQRVTARCKAPVYQALEASYSSGGSLDSWINETAGPLLPEAWEHKEFIDMPSQ